MKIRSRFLSGSAALLAVLTVCGSSTAFPQDILEQSGYGTSITALSENGEFRTPSAARYVDTASGLTVEELVRRALNQNGELLAVSQQVEAARGRITQARLRPNPTITVGGLNQINGPDNNISIGGSLPLELFGRRARRVEVGQRELDLMQQDLVERERQLAAAVRSKYGEALAALRNLRFTEDLLNLNGQSLKLISARVEKGATPALEDGIQQVEVSRIDTLRTEFEARLELMLLELKNLAGMKPGEPLKFKGEFEIRPAQLTQEAALARALAERPDVLAARAAEQLAMAQLRHARTDGRLDASLVANYQRTDFGFDVNGLSPSGSLRRVQGIFHDFSYGVSISLPVRNRNQGAIQAAAAQIAAARHRREFAELVAAREVAAAYVRYEKARQRLQIYDRGVRNQAQRNLQVIRQTYELGRTPLLDVVAEQRRYIDIETGYTDVLNHHYQSIVELERAIGGSPN